MFQVNEKQNHKRDYFNKTLYTQTMYKQIVSKKYIHTSTKLNSYTTQLRCSDL